MYAHFRNFLLSSVLVATIYWPQPGLAEWALDYRALYLETSLATNTVLAAPKANSPIPTRRGQQDIALSFQGNGWTFHGAGYLDQDIDQGIASSRTLLNELYYDFDALRLDWSLGKKVLEWGVGHAFRPLDVVQRRDRLADQPRGPEGLPMILAEQFSEQSSTTLVVTQRSVSNIVGATRESSGFAIKYYRQTGQTDVYGIAHVENEGATSMGTGFSSVSGKQLEWHASVLYLSSYEQIIRDPGAPLLAVTDPFIEQLQSGGLKALIGGTWTWKNGISMLFEAWHDGTAYTLDQWESLRKLSQQQRALLGTGPPDAAIYNNLNWNSRIFSNPNILQNNILLRFSYDGERLDSFAEVLWTPDDGGQAIRISGEYEFNDNLRFFLSWRGLGGDPRSAYAEAPLRSSTSFGLRASLVI